MVTHTCVVTHTCMVISGDPYLCVTLQVKRMVISTYQAASGAGQAAMDELELQTSEVLQGKEVTKNIFPFQVHLLCLCLPF